MSGARQPTVSVIVPAYNSERFIRASLQSVIEQSYTDYEVIVVDDGSRDGTRAAILSVNGPIRYVHQQNQGPAAARNTGIGCATGELICFLDADDLWAPEKLQTQVAFMEQHPDVGLVFADEDEFDDSGVQVPSLLATSRFSAALRGETVVNEAFQKLLVENFIPTSTVMARRACFDTAGLFDVALRGPEDRDMWSRIAAYLPIACLPIKLGRKRAVPTSVSRDVEMTLRSRIRLWQKAHELFPQWAPAHIVAALLAPTYVQLGYILLNKNNTREARTAGLKTFGVSRRPYEWFLAASLVMFSFTGRSFAQAVFRAKRWVAAGRGSPSAS